MNRLFVFFDIKDWKRGIALVILYTNLYQFVLWAPLSWGTELLSVLIGVKLPVPPLLPWEMLAAGTGLLAAVGGIETVRQNTLGADKA